MRRRVALVIGQLTRGGAEGQLTQVATRLDRTRFDPVVYCLSSAAQPYAAQIEAAGVRVQVVEGHPASRLRQLAGHFKEDDIEVVHSWLYLANAATGLLQLLSPRRALITSARNRKVHGRINQIANVIAFRLSDVIVANSSDVATYIAQRYWAPLSRIRVVVNGIDTERFRPAARTDLSRPLIVTAGRLVEQKNHALFLRAAAQLREKLPAARFAILGDGPLAAVLQAQAADLGLTDTVRFLGERADIDTILPTASMFWLTSRWEGMPNVVLEAMACGLPVIATDVGGARELIDHGVSGFVAHSGDESAFVKRSAVLLADPDAWQQASHAARIRAESFSLRRLVDLMERLYDEVAE